MQGTPWAIRYVRREGDVHGDGVNIDRMVHSCIVEHGGPANLLEPLLAEAYRLEASADEFDAYPSQFRDPFGYNNGPRCTPLLTSNRCYTFGAEGMLLCLDLQTGARIWQRDTARDWNVPEPFFGVGSTPLLEGDKLIVMVGGSAILGDGHLIVLGEGGKLGLFKLNPKQPEEVCSFQVPQLEYPCWAGPVLSSKRLYLRSETQLICFDLRRYSPDRGIEHSLQRAVLPWGEARVRECIRSDTRPNEQRSPRAKRLLPEGLHRFWLGALLLVGSCSSAATLPSSRLATSQNRCNKLYSIPRSWE